jgi:vancomycin resistance protein YoaR
MLMRAWLVLVFALAGLGVTTVTLVAGHQVLYRDKIQRGVRVWDLHLGGLDQAEAQAALNDHFAALAQTPWELRYGQQTWPVTLETLGVRFDAAETVKVAYAVGRSGSSARNLGERISSLWKEAQVAPVVLYDQVVARRYLADLVAEINRPVLEATLGVNGLDFQATSPQVGRQLDVEATLAALNQAVVPLEEGAIELVVVESVPRIIDATIARDQARSMTSAPLTLYVEEQLASETVSETVKAPPGPWELSREDLAAMLVVGEEPVGDAGSVRLEVTLNQEMLRAHLAPISLAVSRTATNTRFIFNDDTRLLDVIAPGTNGQALDVETTLARINQQLVSTERRVPLAIQVIRAEFNESTTAEELGITELVVAHTTYFAGSSEGRLNNVAVAASKFHGIIIKPGQTFSFNEWLGDVSEEEGYDESLIIFGNETIRDVGGGVCQVSTTAFGAAFWAGFPIIERWAHAYRVGYYEQGDLPVGLDATVYSPLVDLRFVNDTPYHLLIETYIYSRAPSLTFKFYSTKHGRVVELQGPEISDHIPHGDPVYKEDAELAPGEIKQTEWAADGLTAVITRVIRDANTNEVVERKEFKSKFRPWNAVYLVGPGTEVPGHDVIRLDEEEAGG